MFSILLLFYTFQVVSRQNLKSTPPTYFTCTFDLDFISLGNFAVVFLMISCLKYILHVYSLRFSMFLALFTCNLKLDGRGQHVAPAEAFDSKFQSNLTLTLGTGTCEV